MSLLFKAEVVYALRALNKDILQANLANMLQTMPNSQEINNCGLGVEGVIVGVASKDSYRTEVLHLIR